MCLISFSVLSIGHADTGYVVGLWCRFLLIIPYNDFGSFSACSAIICINVDLATPKKKKEKHSHRGILYMVINIWKFLICLPTFLAE